MRRRGLSGNGLAKLFAAGRVAVGAAVLARPAVLTRGLGVDSATGQRVVWLVRMFGVRDLVVGAGSLYALARRTGTGPWLLAGAASDAVDAAAMTTAIRQRVIKAPPGALGAAMAAVSVAVQARAGWETRRPVIED